MSESQQHKSYKVWEPTLLAICTVLGLIAGSQMLRPAANDQARLESTRNDKGNELNEIVRFIEEKYVDDVDADALISSAVEALLRDLDPHSGYLSPDEVSDLNDKMEGHFEGIGIEFQKVLDTAIVLYISPDGPADKAGLKLLDRIIMANDSLLLDTSLTEHDMVEAFRKSEGKTVTMKVSRPGVDSLILLKMERAKIPLESVDGHYMIRPDVGYIRINRFSATTYKEFMEHLEQMSEKEKLKDLIIDVRQNPGGYLKEAVNMLSQLFDEKGKLLVYTEGENAPRAEYHSTGKPFYPVTNIAILIDEGSASASEILAGALQDHDRAVIIGTPTYGKGLVQEQYALSNGGALRLTVARYYTPSGRLIQKPYTNGESVHASESDRADTLFYTTGGRSVKGSGGIVPDILVRPDFSWDDPKYMDLYGDLLEYSIHGYHGSLDYTSVDDMISNFPSAGFVANDVLRYYTERGRIDAIDREFLEDQQSHARTMLMGMFGSYLFGNESWFRIMNSTDPVVAKALEVIKDDRKITLKMD